MSTPIEGAAKAATDPHPHPAVPAAPARTPLHHRVTELESQLARLEGFVTQMAADVGRELGL